MKFQAWCLLNIILKISIILAEVVEVPNLALYHVIPKNEDQMRHLNQLRTSDSGVGL